MRANSQLILRALQARNNAYAPYSDYGVGAALLGKNGTIYTGCNVENASYPVCCCAERAALFAAVADGCREFSAIAIVGGAVTETAPLSGDAFPCGICRQALIEFSPALQVIVARDQNNYKEYILSDLLPESFGPHSLIQGGATNADG